MPHKIETELMEVTGLTKKDGEAGQAWYKRLFEKADGLDDAIWKKLSDPAQKWVNAASTALDAGDTIPDFDGQVVEEKANGSKKPAAKKTAAKATPAKAAATKAPATAAKKTAAKAPAATKTAAKAAEAGGKRGRKGLYPLESKITVKEKANPHRKGSKDAAKYAKLSSGMKVGDAVEKGVDWGYLRYAVNREIIGIAGA